MTCVWRVFSYYKLPLWAESQSWSQENSGKHVNWLVTTASDSQSTATSHVQQLIQSLHLHAAWIHMTSCKTKLQNRMSQICQPHNLIWTEKLHFNQGVYKYHLCTGIHPLKSFSFINYSWFPFSPQSITSRPITWHSQNWEYKRVILVCVSDSVSDISLEKWVHVCVNCLNRSTSFF